jgi:hypothetical protein
LAGSFAASAKANVNNSDIDLILSNSWSEGVAMKQAQQFITLRVWLDVRTLKICLARWAQDGGHLEIRMFAFFLAAGSEMPVRS